MKKQYITLFHFNKTQTKINQFKTSIHKNKSIKDQDCVAQTSIKFKSQLNLKCKFKCQLIET